MPCVVILIPKHSFCNTACACMVMQIKLVVVVVVVVQGYVYYPRPLRAPQYSTFACCLIPVLNLVVLLFLLDDTTILPFAGEEKTGDTHICAPVQRYLYPPWEHHNIPSLHVVWLLVVLLVVLDDIDDISFSKKIKVKNEGDTHIACVASVSNRRSYCAKVRAGAKKKVERGGGGEKRKQFTSFPSPSPVIPFFWLSSLQLSRRTREETLATQAIHIALRRLTDISISSRAPTIFHPGM